MQFIPFTSLAFASLASAFPSALLAKLAEEGKAGAASPSAVQKRAVFDAADQLIDVSGEHAFVPPGPGDTRGPCPGLNAMANHGYLPHDGVASLTQYIDASNSVFGMGIDLATLLSMYGAVSTGNLVSWSMGGPSDGLSLLGLDVLRKPQGISYSHNVYENDGSPTRGDLYQYGNAIELQLSQFQELYDRGKAEDNYDLDLLYQYRYDRFQEGIHNNPYFFNAPFSGAVAQPAAWSFVYRFMANHTAEHPEGRLTGEVLKSMYSITGDDGNFTYTPGHERIPENWYKRNSLDPYSFPFFLLDAVDQLVAHPEFGAIGGNTGTVDSFTGVAPEDLTGGVFHAATLAEGNNFMCYGLQLTQAFIPDFLSGVLEDVGEAVDKLGTEITSVVTDLGCPELNEVKKSQLSQFPGFTQSYQGYEGKEVDDGDDNGLVGGLLGGLLG